MKLESLSDRYFMVSVLVPGCTYAGLVSAFVPARAQKEKEVVLLRYLTATAFNYAICSPLIYLLTFGVIFADQAIGQALCWFFITFAVPIVLALVRARIVQQESLGRLYRLLGLRAISPIPTGWEWVFGRIDPCYVLITLTNGTEIAGYFGRRSMASSDPDRRDLYLERVYTVPPDGGLWRPVEHSLGMHSDGGQIAHIEFRR